MLTDVIRKCDSHGSALLPSYLLAILGPSAHSFVVILVSHRSILS